MVLEIIGRKSQDQERAESAGEAIRQLWKSRSLGGRFAINSDQLSRFGEDKANPVLLSGSLDARKNRLHNPFFAHLSGLERCRGDSFVTNEIRQLIPEVLHVLADGAEHFVQRLCGRRRIEKKEEEYRHTQDRTNTMHFGSTW